MGGDLLTVAGGKGANQAVACARLGGQVTFVARIGDDGFGRVARESLEREGIDCRFVTVTAGVASGVALIPVSEDGENAIVVAPGANAHLTRQDVHAASAAFDAADVVVVSLEVPDEAVFAAIDLAFNYEIPVILNPAPARSLPPSLLREVSILTPNESEATLLLGGEQGDLSDAATAAERLRGLRAGSVVLTRGAQGCFLVTENGFETIPAFAVQAVDTVAAGDCFTGALAVEIGRGAELADAVRFASAASALKVTRRGAQPGIPTRAEVDGFLAERAQGTESEAGAI